jgi:Ca2+-transporting ATPase
MGTGCLVAKENADLVIVSNEFSSIYNLIMWGRTIYENVRKFVQF